MYHFSTDIYPSPPAITETKSSQSYETRFQPCPINLEIWKIAMILY